MGNWRGPEKILALSKPLLTCWTSPRFSARIGKPLYRCCCLNRFILVVYPIRFVVLPFSPFVLESWINHKLSTELSGVSSGDVVSIYIFCRKLPDIQTDKTTLRCPMLEIRPSRLIWLITETILSVGIEVRGRAEAAALPELLQTNIDSPSRIIFKIVATTRPIR